MGLATDPARKFSKEGIGRQRIAIANPNFILAPSVGLVKEGGRSV